MGSRRWWWVAVAGLFLLLIAAGAFWLERTRVISWYYVYGLTHCAEAQQASWRERIVGLEEAAVPPLLAVLRRDDAHACADCTNALADLGEHWGIEDERTGGVASALADEFSDFSPSGQSRALGLASKWIPAIPPTAARSPVGDACVRLVEEAARGADPQVHSSALELSGVLLAHAPHSQELHACRLLIRACFRDDEPANRVAAIRLASHPAVSLLQPATQLLDDPDAQVRRAAMLAVGSAVEAVATDDLLRWLHDPDEDVRRLCEAALRGRGLTDGQLKLGRLLTDPDARARLQIIDYVRRHSDLEPGSWLGRLTQDPSPAVRAAAIRAAADLRVTSLDRQVTRMAAGDPSPTVRQMAAFYGSSRR